MMKIKKFTAASIPEALNLVRGEMGEEALILGTSRNRARKGRPAQVEVVAARDRRGGRAQDRAEAAGTPGGSRTLERESMVASPAGAKDRAGRPGTRGRPGTESSTKEIKDMRKLDKNVVSELKRIEAQLKDLLEALDLPTAHPRDVIAPVNSDILNAGFDPAILEGKIPASLLRSNEASDQVVRALVGGVSVAPADDRVLVFLGPSGSGKTTTLLKVARTIFLDNNVKPRVVFFGGKDEDTTWLKNQCRRLGLKFRQVSRVEKMAKLLKKEKSPVLVDTPSISNLGETELRFLVEAAKAIDGMGLRLVVDATMDPWNACAIASCIPHASRMSLVFTKLDEATRIGGAVSASIAIGIPVALVTGGRSVGDGVYVPDAELLSEKILDSVKSAGPGGVVRRG
jgi:flagellar biosynthesis protein FlhF